MFTSQQRTSLAGSSNIKKDTPLRLTIKVVLPRSLGSSTIVLKAVPSTSIRDIKDRVLAHVHKHRNGGNEADRDMKPGGARPGLARGYSMSGIISSHYISCFLQHNSMHPIQ
jgi:hypothetical protein